MSNEQFMLLRNQLTANTRLLLRRRISALLKEFEVRYARMYSASKGSFKYYGVYEKDPCRRELLSAIRVVPGVANAEFKCCGIEGTNMMESLFVYYDEALFEVI